MFKITDPWPTIAEHQGCSDGKLSSDSTDVPMLSQFSSTPTDITNTSDEENVVVEVGERQEAKAPDHILMDVPFPPEQVPEEPVIPHLVPIEVQVNPIPFPSTPDPEVLEPEPLIRPHSYQAMKESEYFRSTKMVWKKTTKKLPKNKPRNTSGGGKQPRSPIKAKPLRTGQSNEIDNAISAGKKIPWKSMPTTRGIKKPH